MELVLASRNRKKIEEIRRISEDLEVRVFTPDDFPGCPDIEEDGTTFQENAVLKAVTVAKYTGLPALADDSGLEVAALRGDPGVRSARYAGEGSDDAQNVRKLLGTMRGVHERSARFVCCIALAYPEGPVYTFLDYAEGTIGSEPRGDNGFGYDPVFFPKGHRRTFAEMGDDEKDSLSHRGKALGKLRHFLKQKI